jgi:hypothetical protein
MLLVTSTVCGQSQPTQSTRKPVDLKKALNLTEFKIEMGQTTVRVNPSDKNVSDLIAALEEYLNTTCLESLLKTLKYEGNPTDPLCIERTQQLLTLNPDNPVALCVRDGIDAPTCRESYPRQRLVPYTSSSVVTDIDPTLKVGLSAQENAMLAKLQQDLRPLDGQWAAAQTEADKRAVLEAALPTYDNMLATACRVVVLRVTRLQDPSRKSEDSRIKETREKLLKIPRNLRAEYQERMATDVEESIAKAKGNEKEIARLTELLNVIHEPEMQALALTASNSERIRYVLPGCFELLKVVRERAPLFPSPTCHADGWYSPQCITAIKGWREYKRKQAAAKEKKEEVEKKNTSIISKF